MKNTLFIYLPLSILILGCSTSGAKKDSTSVSDTMVKIEEVVSAESMPDIDASLKSNSETLNSEFFEMSNLSDSDYFVNSEKFSSDFELLHSQVNYIRKDNCKKLLVNDKRSFKASGIKFDPKESTFSLGEINISGKSYSLSIAMLMQNSRTKYQICDGRTKLYNQFMIGKISEETYFNRLDKLDYQDSVANKQYFELIEKIAGNISNEGKLQKELEDLKKKLDEYEKEANTNKDEIPNKDKENKK